MVAHVVVVGKAHRSANQHDLHLGHELLVNLVDRVFARACRQTQSAVGWHCYDHRIHDRLALCISDSGGDLDVLRMHRADRGDQQ